MDTNRRRSFLVTLFAVAWVVIGSNGCTDGGPPDTGQAMTPPQSGAPRDQLLLAATRVALPPAGIMLGDLPDPTSPGAKDVGKYCIACHAIPSPVMHSATDWPSVIRRMWLRMDRVVDEFGVPIPTPSERLVMLEYLLANSLKVRKAALPDVPGREAFVTTCSRCHELADPTQHSPQDWVAVVRRMTGHMDEMLGLFLSQREFQEIVLYLEVALDGGE